MSAQHESPVELVLSPFGMDECSVCDKPATIAYESWHHATKVELIPECDDCARELRAAFPDTRFVGLPA